MNERIRELAEQAFFDDTTSQPSSKMYIFSELKMQKFAELIVRECIDIVDDAVLHREPASTYVGKIQKHFGVEE